MLRIYLLSCLVACGGAATPAPAQPTPPRDYSSAPDADVEADCTRDVGDACAVFGARLLDKVDFSAEHDPNLDRARGALIKACDLKVGAACSVAGRIVATSGNMDMEGGFALVLKGCPLGDTESCFQVGNAYREGYATGGENPAKAIEYYDMACKVAGYQRQQAACELAAQLRGGK
jgi:hypothetical protein